MPANISNTFIKPTYTNKTNKINNTMQTQSIFDNFVDLAKSFNRVYPLAAIWFDSPIQTSTERTVRITKGHELRIESDHVVNVTDTLPATHKVIECMGTIGDNILRLEVESLETNEVLTINVK